MAGVFVSYAREDAAKAKAVARALQQASLDVWFDERIHSRRLLTDVRRDWRVARPLVDWVLDAIEGVG